MEMMPVKSTRLKSAVWNDFDRVKQKDNSMVAICRHCEKKLSASSTSGTSHLKNHLNRCRRKNNRDPAAQQLIVVRGKQKDGASGGGGGGGLGSIIKFEPEHFKFHRDQMDFMFDQERSRFDLALMIIMHEYPLSMVEHVGFKRFLKNLQPAFQLVSSDTVKSDCMQIYQKEKQKVYEMLDKVPGRISLTADLWTSYQDHGYLCLTAHYFDQFWLPQKKILNFVMVDLLAEQALAETVISCLMEWDIDRKLFSVTFDNNSTNDNVTRIRDRLSQNRLLLSHGRLFHVRCGTHIISLLAQDVLGALHEFTHNIRESVRYVNSSETMQQKFIEIAQQVIGNVQRNLCLDCPTQWNSTYIMLETALEYRLAFSHLQACDSDYKAPSDDEWQRAKTLINCLKLFVEVTSVFSSIKHPTANLYFPEFCDIHLQLIQWFHSEDELISSVAKEMLKRFNTYWSICGSLLAIAVILDPRFKMKLAEYYYPLIYGINAPNHIKDVASGVKELFNGYAISSTLTSIDQDFACVDRDGHNGSLPSGSNDSRDRLSGFDEFLHKTSENQHVKSELDKYLEEPVFPRKVDFNVLNWWNVNAPKYPILSMMARDVLGVPMSAVAPGLAFSTASKVLDPYRSSLSPDIVQALICTHDWLQNDLQDFEPAPSQSTIPLSIAAS